jgi:hypothetical protein
MNKSLQKNLTLTCLCGAISILSGCASISSEFVCGQKFSKPCESEYVDDGIVYYMPKRNIRLDISIAKEDVASSSNQTSPANKLAPNQTLTSTTTITTTGPL